MHIANVPIRGRLILAPMAGVTDRAFRQICREQGAALTVTEMVSAKALHFGDKKTPRLLALGPDEHPAAAQIFGSEPETMAEGAVRAHVTVAFHAPKPCHRLAAEQCGTVVTADIGIGAALGEG